MVLLCWWTSHPWPISLVAKLELLMATSECRHQEGGTSGVVRKFLAATGVCGASLHLCVPSPWSFFTCTVLFLSLCLLMQTDSMFSPFKDKLMQRCFLLTFLPFCLFVLFMFLKDISYVRDEHCRNSNVFFFSFFFSWLEQLAFFAL